MGKSTEIKKDPWDPIVEDAAKGLASVVELAEEIAQKRIERRNQAVSGCLISAAMGHDLETHLHSYCRFATRDLKAAFDDEVVLLAA